MTTPPPSPQPLPDPVIAQNPVGEVVRTAHGPEGLATASYDPTETWRFRLSRVWDPAGSRCVFVMLNPSTATEQQLDPTVRRCVRFAQAWGHGALEVVNVFAFRATKPSDMKSCADPIGQGNDVAITAAARAADLVVAAWGTHAAYLGRGPEVKSLIAAADSTPHYLRLTKKGHPGHPLYVPSGTLPAAWV